MIFPPDEKMPAAPAPEWVLGLDLGQRRDYSAIAVLDWYEEVTGERDPATYQFIRVPQVRLRHVERVRLGTPFQGVVDRVSQILHDTRVTAPALVIDANGLGSPVVELFRAARLPCRLIPVQTTAGAAENCNGIEYRVPKRELIAGLQVLFERWPFAIAAAAPGTNALIKELVEFKQKSSSSGRRKFEGAHDDLVMALALAWWWMRKRVAWNLPPAT